MNRLIYLQLNFFIFFYTIITVTCPTCVGLPQKGSRPFFERSTITYIQHDSSTDNSNESTNDTDETTEEFELTQEE